MRFSVWPAASQPWSDIRATAEWAQQVGLHGVWVSDHLMSTGSDPDEPVHECWSLLCALGSAVPRVRLGSLVSSITFRHVGVLQKQAETLEAVAGPGRVVVGVGAGWHETEHARFGIPFPSTAERLDALDRACRTLRSSGRRVLVGGGGEERTMRIAAQHADEWNYWAFDGFMRKLSVLDERCHEAGRDPRSLGRSTQALLFLATDAAAIAEAESQQLPFPRIVGSAQALVDALNRLAERGVDEFVIPDFALPPAGEHRWDMLGRLHDEVLANVH